eukprot:6142792-Lingulodinium_polyedra.AAC.1
MVQYAGLTFWEHGLLLSRARNASLAKKKAISAELEALEAKRKEVFGKFQEEQNVVQPVRMSACQLSVQSLDLYQRL